MTPEQVLLQARSSGIAISVEEGKLAVTPASRLSPELRQAIRDHKAKLVQVLSGPNRDTNDGWDRMRRASPHLGNTVSDGQKQYQLWGITPRGGICFDGKVLRTLDLEELGV